MKTSNLLFTLEFDETTTTKSEKQLDILVRFWSSLSEEIGIRYLNSLFFGHAKALTVCDSMLSLFVELGIPISNLFYISSDGPKSVETNRFHNILIINYLKSQRSNRYRRVVKMCLSQDS